MKKIKIGDVCEILNGFAFKSEQYVVDGIRIIRIANVQKGYIEDSSPVFYPENTIGLDKYMLKKGDLLMSLTGNVGRVALLTEEFLPAVLNQRVACLRLKTDEISKSFLYYYLNSDLFERLCVQSSNGVAQKNMSTEWLKEYKIPLYGREEQKAIVSILDRDSAITVLRKQELIELDNLIKSRFVEMFGDISNNSKGFKMKTMGECCSFIGGAQPDKKFFEYEPTEHNVRLIQIRDYKTDRYITYIPKTLVRKTCNENDIMIGRYGPPIFQILKGISGAYNVALMKAVPTNEFNIEYFRYVLKDIELLQYLESFSSRTAGQDGIQMDKLRDYPCFVPPIELQNQYADFVQHVDKLKFTVQKSLDETQELFDSLMQEYFG